MQGYSYAYANKYYKKEPLKKWDAMITYVDRILIHIGVTFYSWQQVVVNLSYEKSTSSYSVYLSL